MAHVRRRCIDRVKLTSRAAVSHESVAVLQACDRSKPGLLLFGNHTSAGQWFALLGIAVLLMCVLPQCVARGQSAPSTSSASRPAAASGDEVPLIDTPPFDLIVLTVTAGGESVKITPIADRNMAQRPSDSTKLEVVLLSHPDRKYEIAWRDIARIELYERMVYDEALKKLAEKDFISAFMNLSFLMRNYPDTPNLEKLRLDFLFQSAAMMFAESKSEFSRYFQTMSTLEELHSTAPDYEQAKVLMGLSRVTDELLRHYQSKNDMSSAKMLLERLERTYGNSLPSVVTWKNQFLQMAEDRKQEAITLMNAGRYREARTAALDMTNISSAIEGGNELLAEIRRKHPMVRVGVMQRAGELDPGNLFSWSARRAGMLTYRSVVQFLETGSEGGKYQFALGKMKLSEDHLQLTLTIDPKIPAGINGYDLAQILGARATPGTDNYDASWAAIVQSVATPGPTTIQIRLQRPHVLPYALLQFCLPDSREAPSPLPGHYQLQDTEDEETSFVLRKPNAPNASLTGTSATSTRAPSTNVQGDQAVEIIEVFYDDPKAAINDLLRGEIDVLDQLYPADARRYQNSKQFKLGNYALPTIHMLVPLSDHPYLAKDKFRRALMYSTNRNEILRGELINSDDPSDGRLVSGPFPIGSSKNDPLNYAYDESIKPMPYDPRLAKLLLYMVDKEISAQSAKLRTLVPENKPLRVAVPNFELARVAAQALVQQWSLIGIKAELVLLPEGRAFDSDLKCDLAYVTATMWEPAIDIERLLGGNGPASSNNAFIIQGLTRLRQARSWRETRNALQDLHRLVADHLPLLPLWQITDRFAYSPQLQGLSPGAVALYGNVSSWRLVTPSAPIAARSQTQ